MVLWIGILVGQGEQCAQILTLPTATCTCPSSMGEIQVTNSHGANVGLSRFCVIAYACKVPRDEHAEKNTVLQYSTT